MKAQKLPDGDGFYEIVYGQRWWTASKICPGSWYIVNESGRQIVAKGTLGKRILQAVIDAGGVL